MVKELASTCSKRDIETLICLTYQSYLGCGYFQSVNKSGKLVFNLWQTHFFISGIHVLISGILTFLSLAYSF